MLPMQNGPASVVTSAVGVKEWFGFRSFRVETNVRFRPVRRRRSVCVVTGGNLQVGCDSANRIDRQNTLRIGKI